MKTGVIDVGGGLRGIYAAGENPLDYPALRDNPMEFWYPAAAEKLRQRAELYNEGVAVAQRYAGQGKVLIITPDDTCGVDTLKRDKDALKRLYKKGRHDAQKIVRFMQN